MIHDTMIHGREEACCYTVINGGEQLFTKMLKNGKEAIYHYTVKTKEN